MRYLTHDLLGIGGRLKERYEDFVVDEVPLYEPCGEGEHVYFEIEKRGLPAFEAVRMVAKGLGVRPRDVGYAGMKDAKAVTRQVLSVAGVAEADVQRLDSDALHVRWVKRHRNKLKLGHLKGNRFAIRVRGVDESALERARSVMSFLERIGAPNYFGEQRFGSKGETHLPGRLLLLGDVEGAIRNWIGRPSPNEGERLQRARALFDEGDYREALDTFPPMFRAEARALRVLIETDGDWRAAFRSVPRDHTRLFISAYQSHLFNRLVEARIDGLDQLWAGDLAYKHDNGAAFIVEDAAAEQPRCDVFEISPSGPLYGGKLKFAEGKQGERERELLGEEGLTIEDFKSRMAQGLRGARRPLRFPVSDVDVSYDDGVVLSFFLPKGCYATTVLDEVMKVGQAAPLGEQGGNAV